MTANAAAEAALVSLLLSDNSTRDLCGTLEPAHFGTPVARVYALILELLDHGVPANRATLATTEPALVEGLPPAPDPAMVPILIDAIRHAHALRRGHTPQPALREPPQNIRAEQALLGALLSNNKALETVAFLKPEHFADPAHGHIFRAIARRVAQGHLADAVTLKVEFENSGILNELGGTAYLVELLASMVTISGIPEYGKVIHDAWMRRQVIDISAQLQTSAFGDDPEAEPRTIVIEGVDLLTQIGADATTEKAASWAGAIDEAVEGADRAAHAGEGACLLTGIRSLDDLWGGFWPGFLDILGARLGQGKTALAMQIAEHIARNLPEGRAVQIFSLDMSRADLANRMLASATGIPSDDIRRGRINHVNAEALLLARKDLRSLPLLVPDKASMTISELCMIARTNVRRRGVAIIIVDHMMRIRPDASMRGLSRAEQVDTIAWTLKELAKDLEVPVLALSQLSRTTDRRDGPQGARPQISDLAYAGETHADNIALLWREETYLGKRPPDPPARLKEETRIQIIADWEKRREAVAGKAEIILAKRRFGQIGAVTIEFDGPRTRFSDVKTVGDELWGDRQPQNAWVKE